MLTSESIRARFWEAQVPMTVVTADQAGVHAISTFGQRVTFPTQEAVDFFLLGFKMGEMSLRGQEEEDPFAVPPAPMAPWGEGEEGE